MPTTLESPQTQKENPMKKRKITITAPDHALLSDMIAFGNLSMRERGEARALNGELELAEIVSPDAVPPNVITMNSRAELLDLDTSERMEFSLVFPQEADFEAGKVSVLAPVGTGMLGCRVGDSFQRRAPYGMRRLKVMAVIFQPETAPEPAI
jgi:regulator of nucleoside diphosphate kinase